LSPGPSLSAATGFFLDHACYPCTVILLATSRSRLTLTLMSTLRPMSCIPILYTCLLSSDQFLFNPLSPSTVLSFVLLCDVSKKYIIPPWYLHFFPIFFFPPSSYHLGGVILICGVRICNVVAISIVQYNMSGLMEHVHEAIARSCMRVKEYRGILVFVFGVASCQMGRRILSASNSHPDHLPRTFSHASTVPRALKILPSIASSRPRCMSCH
jgi:hypothetical protein